MKRMLILSLLLLVGCAIYKDSPPLTDQECNPTTIEVTKEIEVEKIVYVNKTEYIYNNTCNISCIYDNRTWILIRQLKACENKINQTWEYVDLMDDYRECNESLNRIKKEIE